MNMHSAKETNAMQLFSMGMFCIDEIHTSTKSFLNVIGGAGTYAALGAGTVVPRSERHNIGFICDEGSDFPEEIHKEMNNWALGIKFRRDEARVTTKAWNKFVGNEERLFKYLSPKLQIFAKDLPNEALSSACIHLICSPQRCDDILKELKSIAPADQKYIWEPVPTECTPAQFENLRRVLETFKVDILSPNALEAAAFVGLSEPTTMAEVELLDKTHFQFVPTIVIRCGAMGSYLRTQSLKKWYPPYFSTTDKGKVVDPSGAGNAFTGALGLALARRFDWDTALAYASVGASFMIEQVGTPDYDAEQDLWNGYRGPQRVQEYLSKLNKN